MDQSKAEMTIDELAAHAHVSTRNIRAYIERGLLDRPRIDGRTGRFDQTHLERLQTIARLQRSGFSLAAILAVTEAWERGASLGVLLGREGDRGPLPVSPLLPSTKFQAPANRSEHVARRRCLDLIGTGPGAPHVLLSAPPGSGKSTLAAQLLEQSPGHRVWVSLEARDDEAGQFWNAIITGIRAAMPEFGAALAPAVLGGGEIDQALTSMIDEIAACEEPLTIVIDDLQAIESRDVLESLEWLLFHSPRNLRIVICSRLDPPIGTALMLMRGTLLILRGAELRFDDDEADEFLTQGLNLELPEAQVRDITATTDGWAAGIYLAALTVRSGVSVDDMIAGLVRGDERLREYFTREVVDRLDPDLLSFLEGISILERFTAELCDAVLERTDSRQLLAALDATNMFVIRLDPAGGWWRLHHLFASALREGSIDRQADVATRRLRAARWHEQQGNTPEAVDQFIAAAAYDDAIRLISSTYPLFMNVSRKGAIIERWLAEIPADATAASPSLNLAMVGVAGLDGDQPKMRQWLARARRFPIDLALPDGGTTGSSCDLMQACFHFGDMAPALAAARSAFRTLPPTAQWRPMAGAALALLAYWVDGATDEILGTADEVIADPRSADQPIALAGVWALKGAVMAERGHHDALAFAQVAAQIRANSRIGGMPQAANIWASTARVHLLIGDVDQAAADSQAGYDVVSAIPPERDAIGAVIPTLIGLTHARRRQGRDADATLHATEAARRLRHCRSPGRLGVMLKEVLEGAA